MQKGARNASVTSRYAGCVTPTHQRKTLINRSNIDIRVPGVMNRFAKAKLYRYALRTP
jgi:hypothetical protein